MELGDLVYHCCHKHGCQQQTEAAWAAYLERALDFTLKSCQGSFQAAWLDYKLNYDNSHPDAS